MRLLVLSFYFTPDLSAGSFRVQALCKAIAREYPNAKIDILTTMPNRYSSFTKPALEHEEHNNLTITRLSVRQHSGGLISQTITFADYSIQVLKNSNLKKYDLIFASSSRLMTAALGALVSQRQGIILYIDIRDLFLDTILSVYSLRVKFILHPLINLIERYTFNTATKINLVSEGFKDYCSKKYPHKDLSFYTNGIDNVFLKNRKPIKTEKLDIETSKDKIKILYAGNIGEGQVIDMIIPQLSRILENSYEFIIIGDGSRKEKLKKVIRLHKIKNIEILDPLPRDDLIRHYQNADILFLHLDDNLAFQKVLPSKIFEYAASGKPILAGVTSYPKIFLDTNVKNAQTFRPTDAKDAARALKDLSLSWEPRDLFIEKFKRSTIMREMAKDIFSLHSSDYS